VEHDPAGNPGGKRAFQKYFGDMKVANFGVSSDTSQGILWACRTARVRAIGLWRFTHPGS
jgi:hypothetical protein